MQPKNAGGYAIIIPFIALLIIYPLETIGLIVVGGVLYKISGKSEELLGIMIISVIVLVGYLIFNGY